MGQVLFFLDPATEITDGYLTEGDGGPDAVEGSAQPLLDLAGKLILLHLLIPFPKCRKASIT